MRLIDKCIINITGTVISLQFNGDAPIEIDASVNLVDFNTVKNNNHIGLVSSYYGIGVACIYPNLVLNGKFFTDIDTAYSDISGAISKLMQDGGSTGTMDYNKLQNKPSINGETLSGDTTIPIIYWDIKN